MSTASFSRVKSLAGLARAFRRWGAKADLAELPDVPGATTPERQLLGALGGIAASIGGGRLSAWPEQVRIWAESAPAPPSELTEVICEFLGHYQDPLSALYEASISAPNRRRLGTVFTPKPLVDYMLDLAADELPKSPACVVDPGAGVGAFTLAAARRWPRARVLAIDINVVTLGLLAARIAFEMEVDPDESHELGGIELVLGDYLDHLPEIFSSKTCPGPTLALGNPPYTRIQELSDQEKRKAAKLSATVASTGHANLAVLFQAATFAHLRENDVSCMVLPGSLSYTHASKGLREALWNSRRSISIARTPATTRAFAGRSVQAAVLTIGTEHKKRDPLRLARVGMEGKSVEVIESWKRSRLDAEPENWFWSEGSASKTAEEPGRSLLSAIAEVRRGVATGANELFFLTDADAEGIPEDVLVPAVPSLRGFDGDVLTETSHRSLVGRRWLLAIPPDYHLDGPLLDRIRQFEPEVKDRHLPSKRKPWYSITDLFRPQIMISPLSKFEFRVVLNDAGAVPSNNLFGISLRNSGSPAALASWLRSKEGQERLRRLSRRYHGGSYKLEPGSLQAVEVPETLELAK